MKTLAQFVQQKRDRLGLSPRGLAEKCNIELSLIEDIESGKELFLPVTIRQSLAKGLRCAPEEIKKLEKDFSNFHFHLALDRPDPAADAAGVKYTPGFVHQVMLNTYLKDHEAPEDIEYYMCGPGPMSKAVEGMLDSLGVPMKNLMFDNFG